MEQHLKPVQEKFESVSLLQDYQPIVIQEIQKKVQTALD